VEPHFFNTEENLDYVGPIPDASYYGVNEMSESLYGTKFRNQKSLIIGTCWKQPQDDVTVLRQAFQVFRREFMQIGNIDVFLEAITIASACNKVLPIRFLKPHTIGLFPTGGYN